MGNLKSRNTFMLHLTQSVKDQRNVLVSGPLLKATFSQSNLISSFLLGRSLETL